MQILCGRMQDQQELEHRLKEVACDLRQRVRQELAFPAIVHFYTWLLQGACCCSQASLPTVHLRTFLLHHQRRH